MKCFHFTLLLVAITLCAGCGGFVSSGNAVGPPSSPVPPIESGGVDWPVWGFDPARSGFNPAEHKLTIANVHRLHMRWKVAFPEGGFADSAPVLVERVRIGSSYRPMLFETTKRGVTFGIDATSGRFIWKFATTGGLSTVSAPAADPSRGVIYAPGIDGKVHKLDPATGRQISTGGFPVLISLMPHSELDESPLNVANGYVYATLSGSGSDHPPYDGHVVALSLKTGKKTIYNSLCSDRRILLGPYVCKQQRSGIWSRGGAVVDPDPAMHGRIYVATGNGEFDANQGGHNHGDSVLALSPDLSNLEGSYTPADYGQLQDDDLDLGSTSPALLPEQPTSKTPWMLVQGGKDGVLKLVDRAPLSGVGRELQLIHLGAQILSTPAVWTDPSNRAWVFVGLPNSLHAYLLETGSDGRSHLVAQWSKSPGTSQRGTSPVIANGILFIAFNDALFAFNATTGAELWSSTRRSAGKSIGVVHFESPIVVNGWVYCSDQSDDLTAYTLP
jgi:outer membrane protein assembly factor BamB